MQTPSSSSSSSAPRRYWLLVVFLVLASALGSFFNDMFTPALPAMCRFFHTSVPTMQMGITTGMIGLALGQFLLGPLSDRYGRKPILICSLLLFIVAAVVSVYSASVHFFIWCRLFQGLGASGGYFLARTMPADIYSGRPLAKLMALVGAINGVAPASAPVFGGVASDTWGWQSVFVILAVFAAVVLVISHWVKESLPPSRRATGSWLSLFGGYAGLVRRRPFMVHVCFKGLALGILFAYISASPYILQNHYGLSQTVYGLVIGANALFVVTGSMLALRFRPLKRAAFAGSGLVLAAVAAQAYALWHVHSIWVFEGCTVIMLLGLGLIFTTTNTLSMNEGRDRAGEASAILGISGYVVGAVAAPMVGMGNVLHSTAIVYLSLACATFVCAIASRRLAPDLDTQSGK